MTDTAFDYWDECVSCSCADNNIPLSREHQIIIARDILVAYENRDLAFHVPENPLKAENESLKKSLDIERRKVVCPTCKGSGSTTTYGPVHCATSQCFTCKGEGKVKQ